MKLSEHFDSDEFKCHHCGEVHVDPALVISLEDLRATVGLPIRVISGYRCDFWNKQQRGKPDSQHLRGTAADITCDGFPLTRFFLRAAGVPRFHSGGIGIYPQENFIHVDVRPNKARWGFLHGVYVSFIDAWEEAQRMEGK